MPALCRRDFSARPRKYQRRTERSYSARAAFWHWPVSLVSAVSTCGHTPSFHGRIVLTITALFPVSIGDENAGCAPAHFPEERHEA
jgi:hypothetical protein